VAPGSPGHAVVVLDVATDTDGAIYALLGQGFMPAQEFHVVKGSGEQVVDNVWWRIEPGKPLDTPSWKAFSPDSLRRFD
jgi:gentisate 1,2-dioxygenase